MATIACSDSWARVASLGEHVYLGTQAAIKVLQTRLAEDERERFLGEARMVARLIHPHIVRVLEFGVEDEAPFLVMDYAPNGTLRGRLPGGAPLAAETILPYVKQIADALGYAHAKGLVHRDVKPENMLLGRDDEVLLSDFGIALLTQSTRFENTQEVFGTATYMAPNKSGEKHNLPVISTRWEWSCMNGCLETCHFTVPLANCAASTWLLRLRRCMRRFRASRPRLKPS